jgi:hypothetical protein
LTSTIVVTETLEYTGAAPLSVKGAGQTIDGSGLTDNSAPIFEVTNGADLSISKLTFDAGGGNASGPYGRENPGGGKGIFVDIPFERTGVVSLDLTNVTVMGTGNHRVHVSDCTLGDDCGNVMLEAIACGLPVAAFPVTGTIDVVRPGETGILDNDLKRACEHALDLDPTACRQYAQSRSWTRSTEQFVSHLTPKGGLAHPASGQHLA